MPSVPHDAAPSCRAQAAAHRPTAHRPPWCHPWSAALFGAALSLLSAGGAIAQESFDVAMRDGLLSVRANGASAAALAAALTEESGVRFVVAGDAEQAITAEIVDKPLLEAVRLLAPNHLLMRAEGGADAKLIEVVLMMDDAADGTGGGGDETEFLPSGAPPDEVLSDESSATPATGELGLEPNEEGGMSPSTIGPDGLPPEDQLGPVGEPAVQ